MTIRLTILIALYLFSLRCFSQIDNAENTESHLTFSGYAEMYYAYDFGASASNRLPDFMFNYNRHNEVNLNLGFIKAAYNHDGVRSNLALMTGTYAGANLAHEPEFLQNIFEANIGVKLSKNHDLWLDAGIFESHIGFEGAIGQNCRTLTRGILAESSPYYEAGVKVSYTSKNQKWFASALLLNGWQRITRVAGSSLPAFGHELTFKPSNKISLTSSSFVGTDFPDNQRKMRYFHNFYGIFEWNENVNFVAGFDVGAQQESKSSSQYDVWYTPVLITQIHATHRLSFSARAEYYSDPENVIISSEVAPAFRTFGYSMNADIAIREGVMWRTECRTFQPRSESHWTDANYGDFNFILTTALSIAF